MPISLSDELDATFRELDELAEQGKLAQTYERALMRMRYLAPGLAAIVEEMRRVRESLPGERWAQLRALLLRERPAELEALGRALLADDEQFMRLVSYVGFAHGALVTIGDTPGSN
jgi:hypothetical protein